MATRSPMIRLTIISALISALLLQGCKKDNTQQQNNNPSGQYDHGVWVVNEGTYNFGNTSIDFYHKDKDQNEKNVFANVNGRPLGDVLQSIYAYNGKYYLMVNNSQKAEVTDGTTFKSTGVINGLNSPRYFLPVSNDKAYITDLYAKAIWVVNPSTNQVIKKIPYVSGQGDAFYGWTEQMLLINDKVWVCGVKTGQIAMIDTKTDVITDSIQVGIKPQWIQKDKENKVWVLCNANYEQQTSRLLRIDPDTRKIIQTYSFPSVTDNPIRLAMHPAGDTVYYINKGICKMDIHAGSLPAPFIDGSSRNFYGLGIDPENNILYVGDGVDNVQPGTVYRYTPSGKLLSSFGTGVSPMDFLFVKK